MISPIVDVPAQNPWSTLRRRSRERFVVNPIRSKARVFTKKVLRKRSLGLKRCVSAPQKVAVMDAHRLVDPIINPVQIRVCFSGYGLTLRI